LTSPGFGYGLSLMAIEPQRLRAKSEYFAGRVVEVSRRDQLVDRGTLQEPRIYRKERIRPEALCIVLLIDLSS
jgi:hypothetical protein